MKDWQQLAGGTFSGEAELCLFFIDIYDLKLQLDINTVNGNRIRESHHVYNTALHLQGYRVMQPKKQTTFVCLDTISAIIVMCYNHTGLGQRGTVWISDSKARI